MTTTTVELAGQIADDIDRALAPTGALLGVDLAGLLADRIHGRAMVLATHLCGPDDLTPETARDIVAALWPHGSPEHVGHADWWQSPLGRMCARSLGRDDAEAVTQHVAAAMLGITRGSISVMLTRGTLDRHPDGGVLRASVLQRLGR